MIHVMKEKQVPAIEIHHQLVEIYGDSVMSRQRVVKWCAEFRTGHMTTSNVERSGRPKTAGVQLTKRRSNVRY